MKNKIEKNIIDKFDGKYINDKDLESVSLFEIKGKKKEKRNKNDRNSNKKQVNSYMRRGRKNKNDNTKGNHDKNTPDNIIKKCKRIFFKYIIIFINSIVKKYSSNPQRNYEFKKLNYKNYIDNLKKDKEIILLNMPLKDFISLEISRKYCSNIEFNKEKMKKILKDEKDNEKLNSLLNMTFGEWIDVFTFKKDIELKFNGLQQVLKDFYNNKEDSEYFSRFIFYLFHYKNWFLKKKPRKSKKRNN